jgi:hypothetical protein
VLVIPVILLNRPAAAQTVDVDSTTMLDASIEEYAIADSGRLLVIKMKGKDSLTIYDTAARKISKVIELPSADFVFGAGGDTVVVYLKDSRELQSWSIRTFLRKKTQVLEAKGLITHIVMGRSRGDTALIRIWPGTKAKPRTTLHLLNTATLVGSVS